MSRRDQSREVRAMVEPLFAIDLEITSVTANACAEVWRLAEKRGASPQLSMAYMIAKQIIALEDAGDGTDKDSATGAIELMVAMQRELESDVRVTVLRKNVLEVPS